MSSCEILSLGEMIISWISDSSFFLLNLLKSIGEIAQERIYQGEIYDNKFLLEIKE